MAACDWSLNGCSTEGESGDDGLVRSDSWQMVPVPSYCGNDSAMRAERAFTSHDASKRAASRISTERTITLPCSLSSLVDQPDCLQLEGYTSWPGCVSAELSHIGSDTRTY